MNKTMTRGLALAAFTAGFTFLGATAANAIDLPDLGGDHSGSLPGDGLLGLGGSGDDSLVDLLVDVPVVVDGLNIGVLDNSGLVGDSNVGGDLLGGNLLGGNLLGDGIVAETGNSSVDVLAALGIDTSSLIGSSEDLTAIVGVPLDVSNTWVSIFGNEANGIVVVPNLSGTPAASVSEGVDGLINAFVTAPIDVSCSSVTVLSDYENECTGGNGGSTPGDGDATGGIFGDLLGDDPLGDDPLDGDILDGNLLDGELLDDTNGDGEIAVEDRELGVLDGDTLGEGLETDEGVQVDFDSDDTAGYSDVTVGEFDEVDGLDLSEAWVSALGGREGVVVVPDLTLDLATLTGNLISHEILEPIVIDCVTVTVLSDYERDCASDATDPTDPTDPTEPTEPTDPSTPVVPGDGGDNGVDNNGGNDDAEGITDPCAVAPASAIVQQDQPMNVGLVAAAALAGALAAMGLMLLGRRFGRQQ